MNRSEIQSFGEELRAFRERKRMSQLELAKALGVNRQTIVAWELSKNPPRDRTRVLELARILDLDERETNILLAAAFHDPLPPWHVPYHRNPLFTGREGILQELHRVLIPGTTAAVTQSRAISGLGGVGKTQTALEYAYRYREDYSAVIWLQADTREMFVLACVHLAQELGLTELNQVDQAYIVAAIKRWLKSRTNWLLILDNVEDFSMIEEFLPSGHHGYVLLTTRAHQVTEHIALAHQLEVLPEEEGVLLLLRRAELLALDASPAQANPVDYTQAKELWEMVEGLPLALDQIGAYVHATGCTLAHYQALYVDQQRRFDLLKLRGKIPPGHPESVAATFSVAFEKIKAINPVAAEMLQMWAFLHPKAIPEEIITKGKDHPGSQLSSLARDPILLDQAIESLQTYSLVRRDAHENTLSMHRLIQVVLRDTMDYPTQQQWAKHVILMLNAAFPEEVREITTWKLCQRYLAHVLESAELITRYDFTIHEAAALLARVAVYLHDQAEYAQAEQLYLQALATLEKAGGAEQDIAVVLNNLARLYVAQGRYAEAERLYLRSKMIFEKILEPEHWQVGVTLNSLARLYQLWGRYEEAEPLYQGALAIEEKTLGNEHPEICITLQNLAELYRDRGQFKKAEPLYRKALALSEKVCGLEHSYTSIILSNFAHLCHLQKNYEEAEAFYQRALEIKNKILRPGHPEISITMGNLARLYREQKRYKEAEALYKETLELQKKFLGPEHLYVSVLLGNTGDLYLDQKRYQEALTLYQQALEIQKQIVGSEHRYIGITLAKLARLYHAQSAYTEAESLFQQALTILEKALGPEHPLIAEILEANASLLQQMNRSEEALQLKARAQTIYIKQLL